MDRIEIVNTLTSEGRLTAQVPSMILDFDGKFDGAAWDREVDAMCAEGLLMWIHANGRKSDRVCPTHGLKCRKAHYLYMTPKGVETFGPDLYKGYAELHPSPLPEASFIEAVTASAKKAMGA